jgi:hypothetical protein
VVMKITLVASISMVQATPHNYDYSVLSGVSGTSGADIWSVGAYAGRFGLLRPLFEHWNGKKWIEIGDPNLLAGTLYGVISLGAGDAWRPSPGPDRSSGIEVSEQPKTNASRTEIAIDATLPRLSAAATTMPDTSPIEQPARQCAVAVRRLSSAGASAELGDERVGEAVERAVEPVGRGREVRRRRRAGDVDGGPVDGGPVDCDAHSVVAVASA